MPSGISFVEVWLRLAGVTGAVFFLGFLVSFRERDVSWPWRVFLGIGVGFGVVNLSILLGARAEWGLWAGAAAGALLWAGREARALRLPLPRVWIFPVLPILLLTVVALRAYWPVVVPLSTDPAQHYWFIHQSLSFGGIAQVPTQYPAGTAIVGFLVGTFGGLGVLDFAAMLPLLFVLFLGACLAMQSLSPIQGFFRFMAALSIAWAVKYPGSFQEGYGRMLLLPLLAALAFQPFETSRRNPPALLWGVLALTLPLAVSLNPAVTPVSLLVGGFLAAWLLRRDPRPLRWAIPALLAASLVMVAADPYFHSWLRHGRAAVEPTFTAARSAWSWSPLAGLREIFTVGVFGSSFASGFLLLPMALGAISIRRQWRTGALWLGAYTLAWIALAGMQTQGAGAIGLVRQYGLGMLPFLAAFWVMFLWADVFALDFPRRENRVRFAVFALLFLFWADRPVREIRRLWTRGDFWRPPLPASLLTVMTEAQAIWRQHPHARILLENWNPQIHGEDWIFVPLELARVAYLEGAQPAFFFFQLDDRYSARNYAERVCPRLDSAWLRDLGVTHLALAPGEGGCFTGVRDRERFKLISLARF